MYCNVLCHSYIFVRLQVYHIVMDCNVLLCIVLFIITIQFSIVVYCVGIYNTSLKYCCFCNVLLFSENCFVAGVVNQPCKFHGPGGGGPGAGDRHCPCGDCVSLPLSPGRCQPGTRISPRSRQRCSAMPVPWVTFLFSVLLARRRAASLSGWLTKFKLPLRVRPLPSRSR